MQTVKIIKPVNFCGALKKPGDEVVISDEAVALYAALGIIEKPKQKKEGDK